MSQDTSDEVTMCMGNACSISNPPIFFAARPVAAPKALFIGVCICLPWGMGAPSLNLRHLLTRVLPRETEVS
eukprot:scaffold102511_cov72-Phaeocystis_antarctica.AAC.1